MPIYTVAGHVTLNATIVLEAEDEADAWEQIDMRLNATLYLAGYSKFEDTSADISTTDLAIGRTA